MTELANRRGNLVQKANFIGKLTGIDRLDQMFLLSSIQKNNHVAKKNGLHIFEINIHYGKIIFRQKSGSNINLKTLCTRMSYRMRYRNVLPLRSYVSAYATSDISRLHLHESAGYPF